MPEYSYLSAPRKGYYIWKSASASNVAALEQSLLSADTVVLEVVCKTPLRGKSNGKVASGEKLAFLERLETAFHVGLPLPRAIEMCLHSQKNGFFRDTLEGIQFDIASGMPLSRAMGRWPGAFTGLERALIAAGDQAGIMPQAINQINTTLRRSTEAKQRIDSMLLYPKIVGVVLLLVLGVLLGFTLPRFQGVFAASNVPLPALTQWLLDLSLAFSSHPLIAVSALILSGIGVGAFPTLLRKIPRLHKFFLSIPVIGDLARQTLACNFCCTFSRLLSANVPTLQALQLCRDISWNVFYRESVARACVLVSSGRTLGASLEPMRDILGAELLSMLAFGEKSGSLPDLLDPLAIRMEREIGLLFERFKPTLEAFITVVIAIVIGTIVIAAMLPVFDMVKVIAP